MKVAESLEFLRRSLHEFLYGGSDRAVSGAPYLRDGVSMQRYMAMPVLAAVPALVGAIYFFGWHALVVFLVSLIAGGLVELSFSLGRQRPITEGLLVTGLLYAMLLPPNLPLWMVALGAAMAILSRELFGGMGHNIFNPALVGKAFLIVAFPTEMLTHWAEPFWGGWGGFSHYATHTVTTTTPLMLAQQGKLNLWQLFLGNIPGALGTTSAILVLAGGLFLLLTRTVDWRIALVYPVTVLVGEWLLELIVPGDFRGGPLVHLLTGGILFAAFFNATDPVTSPMTTAGKWLYAILIGLLTLVLRGLAEDPEGITFSILIANALVPLLDRWTSPKGLKRAA